MASVAGRWQRFEKFSRFFDDVGKLDFGLLRRKTFL